MLRKISHGPELKYQYDRLVDQGYLSRIPHPAYQVFLYCYTPKAVIESYWPEIMEESRGLVLDLNGNIVSKGLPKIFTLEETRTLGKKLPPGPYRLYEKIDGVGINAFFIDREPIFHTKSSFNNEYTEWMSKYNTHMFSNLSFSRDKILTVMCELVLPVNKDSVKRVVNCESGVYLLGALTKESTIINNNIRITDLDLHSIKNNWIGKVPLIYHVEDISKIIDINKFLEEMVNGKVNSEGYIVKFQDSSRVKIKTKWFLEKYKELVKVNEIIRNKLFSGLGLDDILAETEEELHEEIREKVAKINKYVDENKYIINRTFMNLYTTNEEQFFKSIRHYGNRKKYFIISYNEKPIDKLLLNDAIRENLKNV